MALRTNPQMNNQTQAAAAATGDTILNVEADDCDLYKTWWLPPIYNIYINLAGCLLSV